MIVKDVLDKSDEELMAMLKSISHEPVEWTPIILAELTRRNIGRLREATQRLECLTRVLIALTTVLALLALPPAVDVVQRLFLSRK